MKHIVLSLFILLLLACSPETAPNDEPSGSNEGAGESELAESQAVSGTGNDEAPASATEVVTLKQITPSADESEPPATEAIPTAMPATSTPIMQSPVPTALPQTSTESPVPTEALPTATVEPLLAPPESFDEAPNWLAGTVADQLDVSMIQEALRDGGYLLDESDWLEVDLSGDGINEWVVMIVEPVTENTPVTGGMRVILVADILNSEVSYHTGSDSFLLPELLQLEDFTGDGVMDLLYQYQTCGAHTCYSEFYILSYHGAEVAQQLLSNGRLNAPVSMDSASWRVEDRTQDGISDLILEGGLIGSVGAGPQRAQTAVYAWNEKAISLFEATYDAANIRYFTLLDANDAFVLGNYDQALVLYEDAALSIELQDSNWANSDESRADEQSAIKRYAGFRLLLIHLWRDEIEPAQVWFEWLLAEYPSDAITEAAQLLYDEYAKSKNVSASCTLVNEYIESIDNITAPLDNMGYANPILTGDMLCPY